MSAQKLKPSGVLGGFVGLIGFSVLAGVLVAAMVTPALAVTSATAKSSIGIFEDLPDSITLGTQSQQNEIYAKQGGKDVLIAITFKQNRKEVSWANVSPFLKDAVVAGEDRRFYEHGGVDVNSIARATIGNLSSGEVQSGGSTLDMQLVKNILIQDAQTITDDKKRNAAVDAAKKTSIDRKLKEMKLAIGLDKRYTKKQILLGYLNIVGMGSNTYGVESAAEEYFSSNAKDLTLPQAASLIAIVQQPTYQSLGDPKNYPANKIRRDQILDAMLETGKIDQKQHDDAIATTVESYVKLSPPISGCRNAVNNDTQNTGLVCDYVTKVITAKDWKSDGAPPAVLAVGETNAERVANWNKGGYKIYTSIDLDLQATAQASLALQAPANETRFLLGATANTVEAGTGRVLVMAQNKIFDDAPPATGQAQDPTRTGINLTTDQPYGGSRGFETGSTYKVFDLANWLQNGHGLNDLVNGRSPQNYVPTQFTASCDPSAIGGPFKLKNDSGGGGIMTVKQALIGSVNNAFMQMATRQDLCSIRQTAVDMGAHLAVGGDLRVNPNSILGSNEQAPLTIAAAAATIGAGGLHCKPIIIDAVLDPAGKKLAGQAPTCNQALTADVAAGVANAMIGSMTGGTSTAGNPRDGTPIAGKTGTSDTAAHVWIMGTTTKLATAVWTGNIQGQASKVTASNPGGLQSLRQLSNPVTKENYASRARFNVFRTIMKLADTLPQYKGGAFGTPSAAVLGGSAAIVPDLTGQTSAQAQSLLTSLQFGYLDGGPQPSALAAGKIVSTNPVPGSRVPVGTVVTVYTSDGSLAATMPDVIAKTRQEADSAIAAAGYSLSNVTITWVPLTGGTANFCRVTSSNPVAGTAGSKSDPITLTAYGKPGPGNPDPGNLCPS